MKKVTILSLHLNHGGIEKYVSNLANLLCDDFNVNIVNVYKICEPVYKIDPRVKITYLMKEVPNKEELKSALKNKNLIRLFKEFLKACKIYIKRDLSIIKYIKQDDSDILVSPRYTFTKYLSTFGNKKSIKVVQEHCHHNNDERYIKKVEKSVRKADYFMAASKELTEFYKNRFNNDLKYKFIPMPIEFDGKVSTLKEKNIITVGRFSKEKGFDELVDVAESVLKKNQNWTWHIAGSGPEFERIKSIISERKLNKNIILHGFCTKDEVYDLYCKSSIYVMTSKEESFGLVLVEASSHKLPLVAFDSAQGAREIIINNKNGYLIRNRNKEAMTDKINELIEDYDLRNRIGLNAYKECQKYNFDKLKNEYINFFKNMR